MPNPYARLGAVYCFKREKRSEIKITEIVDEHMATAKVVRGRLRITTWSS
jgi:hypothetical protein